MTKSFVNIKLSAGNLGMNPMTGGLAPGSLGANGFVVSLLGTMRTRFSDSNDYFATRVATLHRGCMAPITAIRSDHFVMT
jgi:hypothetical protein